MARMEGKVALITGAAAGIANLVHGVFVIVFVIALVTGWRKPR